MEFLAEVQPDILKWILAGVGAVVSGLCAAVVALYKKIGAHDLDIGKRLDDCEKDRERLWEALLEVAKRCGRAVQVEQIHHSGDGDDQ